jgi:hypothetical protein
VRLRNLADFAAKFRALKKTETEKQMTKETGLLACGRPGSLLLGAWQLSQRKEAVEHGRTVVLRKGCASCGFRLTGGWRCRLCVLDRPLAAAWSPARRRSQRPLQLYELAPSPPSLSTSSSRRPLRRRRFAHRQFGYLSAGGGRLCEAREVGVRFCPGARWASLRGVEGCRVPGRCKFGGRQRSLVGRVCSTLLLLGEFGVAHSEG